MTKRFWLLTMVLTLVCMGVAAADYPLADMVAEKVIQKYQQSTCEQLWKEKTEPKPVMAEHLIQNLRSNPPLREHFINKVAAPIANKMFECGMIP